MDARPLISLALLLGLLAVAALLLGLPGQTRADEAQTLIVLSDGGSLNMNVLGGTSVPGNYDRIAIRFIELRSEKDWFLFPVELGTGSTSFAGPSTINGVDTTVDFTTTGKHVGIGMITNSRFGVGIKYLRFFNNTWSETITNVGTGLPLSQGSGKINLIAFDVVLHARFGFGMVEIGQRRFQVNEPTSYLTDGSTVYVSVALGLEHASLLDKVGF